MESMEMLHEAGEKLRAKLEGVGAQPETARKAMEDISNSNVLELFKGFKKKAETVSLSFDKLGLNLRDGKRVLDGVTGSFEAGKLVAIMGPSGAGKTTFMNVLCGKATYGDMVGEVLVNGQTCPVDSIKSITGFVPQDDIVHEKLTVRENIRYSAELRNPAGTPQETLTAIVTDVLSVLQMGHIQTSIVGGVEERGISGGQRKRVNIGPELAASPTLLFLDEPTSGLDSMTSLDVVSILRRLADDGGLHRLLLRCFLA